ncbi:sugar transferase [Globicatella sanguinis]|uniref:sugar transferase n=1 Tax=Globicatella sanguinis TaxID=13076 RepID=UPI002542F1DD|nr:sugar transferase [Globicatella sanguinis]MDK7631222.1 sugar transferase [Globicatella sanguinis]WIK66127.1 sugar transferase [Globicatella sanguinis]WKT55532.1 sugar transferase [Globicatella sanguinis]
MRVKSIYEKHGKRIFDIFISTISLLILLPLFILISILIKLDSKGTIFFLQERLGQDGKPFNIIKFRTMVMGAEKIGDGLSIKSENDSRITKVGNFLRKTSLDELPQLINVFMGQMSLVGPRPPVPYHPYNGIKSYPEIAKTRFDVRPGITGLAQVTVRNSVSWDERIKFDVQYVQELSLYNDLRIIMLTIKKIFNSENIYN